MSLESNLWSKGVRSDRCEIRMMQGGSVCMHVSEMYLVSLVNATFVGRRPAGHLELVDLSVEKKTVEQRYNDKQQQLRDHGGGDDHADLCMQPLFLASPPSSSDSSEADSRERQLLQLETKPQFKQQERVDQVLPSDKAGVDRKDVDVAMKTIKPSRARVAPKLGSLFSDGGGISTRVQRHPLEMIAEQERDSDSALSPRAASIRNTSVSPVLPHPLARFDDSSPVKVSSVKVGSAKENPAKDNLENERKATMRKEQKSSTAIPAPVRKVVRAAKPQQPWREQQRRAPITKPTTRSDRPKPRSCPKPKVPERKQPAVTDGPSLANPVMEKMPQIASPEPPYAWSKKLPNLPKLEVSNMDMDDPDQLRYSSPKMTEWDAQDDLSFRVWERESNPKRKSISVSRDFQDSLDLEDVVDQPTTLPDVTTQSNSPPGEKTTKPSRKKGVAEVELECPSPSSFTCGLSSTSLFSDEEEESSEDVECNRRSFSTFIYSDPMGESTSSDDGVESPELRYFQEAGHREPWLNGAAVLDDTDLQFLLKDDSPVPEISTEDVVISTAASHVRRHSRSSSLSKPKRAVRFAPELARKMSAPRTSIRLPPLPNAHDDEQIYPSVKSWEVDDDEDTVTSSTASTPRRTSWRRSSKNPPTDPAASRPRWRRPCGKCDADRIRRRDQILPCAGRLFSWPQRLASRVSRSSRRLDVTSDDDSVVAGSSVAGSARRDVKIHPKNHVAVVSNLRVADLLDDNFASR